MLIPILLAAAPLVEAQIPTPASQVEVDLDAGPVGIPLGGGHEFPFQVTLRLDNIVCTQPSTATVSLTVEDKPSPLRGVQATVPTSLTFDVPQGNYASGVPTLSVFDASQEVPLSINVTSDALPDHDHAFNVTATFDGQLSGCQGTGPIPAAVGSGEHAIRTGPPAAGGVARGAQQDTTSSAPSESKDAPGPALVLLVAALVVAVLRRR